MSPDVYWRKRGNVHPASSGEVSSPKQASSFQRRSASSQMLWSERAREMRDAMSWAMVDCFGSFSLRLASSSVVVEGSSSSSSVAGSESVVGSGGEDGDGGDLDMPCHSFVCLERARGRKANGVAIGQGHAQHRVHRSATTTNYITLLVKPGTFQSIAHILPSESRHRDHFTGSASHTTATHCCRGTCSVRVLRAIPPTAKRRCHVPSCMCT